MLEIPKSFQVFQTTASGITGSSDGHILAFNWEGNTNGAELYIDTNPTYNISLRQRDSSGNWQNWRQSVTNSGTWDISISGSAAKSHAAIAPNYTQKAYAVGDLVFQNDILYKCTTAIGSAEAWNSSHWTQTTVDAIARELRTSINTLDTLLNRAAYLST